MAIVLGAEHQWVFSWQWVANRLVLGSKWDDDRRPWQHRRLPEARIHRGIKYGEELRYPKRQTFQQLHSVAKQISARRNSLCQLVVWRRFINRHGCAAWNNSTSIRRSVMFGTWEVTGLNPRFRLGFHWKRDLLTFYISKDYSKLRLKRYSFWSTLH